MSFKRVVKYKVGDMVRIREDFDLIPKVEQQIQDVFDNRTTEITKIDGFCHYVEGITTWFRDEQLDPSEKDWIPIDSRFEILDL